MNKLVELHLHLDGSLRPKTIWELAQEQDLLLPYSSLNAALSKMSVSNHCRSLNEYLECFHLPLLILQNPSALERVGYELVEDLAMQNYAYAEIRFAPQLSQKNGLSQDQVTEAVIHGVKRAMRVYPCIKIGLILCCMRGNDNQQENMQTIQTAAKYYGDVVCGVDLAGAETIYDTKLFQPVFAEAKNLNLPITIHAGEAAGPDSMRTALSFGAKRIGHGVAAIHDPDLIQELVDQKITLEVCITSNYQTKVVNQLSDHPLRYLLEAGVRVTINSDNRTVSNTDLYQELRIAKDILQCSDEQIQQMQRYAQEARFLT